MTPLLIDHFLAIQISLAYESGGMAVTIFAHVALTPALSQFARVARREREPDAHADGKWMGDPYATAVLALSANGD